MKYRSTRVLITFLIILILPQQETAAEQRSTVGEKSLEDHWCSRKELTKEAQQEHRTEIDEWRHSHGYFRPEERKALSLYTDDALSELADGGDIAALHAQYQRLQQEGYIVDPEEAKNILMKAAAHGSTQALLSLATIAQARAAGSDRAMEGKKDALAILFTAWKRGDFFALRRATVLLDAIAEKMSGAHYTSVRAASEELYKELGAKRERMGLEPFDNSLSPVMIKRFARSLASSMASPHKSQIEAVRRFPVSPCASEYRELYSAR